MESSLEHFIHFGGGSVKYNCKWSNLGQQMARDVISGICYLHCLTIPVTHFDIKPLNILISNRGVAKLADVGLSKYAAECTRPGGYTPGYSAPEVTQGQGGGTPSDIYSLGVVLSVLWSRQEPSREHGVRLCEDASQSFKRLLKHCMDANPHERPTAIRVKKDSALEKDTIEL